MTDKILVSRKEIEDAIDTLYIETFSGEPYIAGTRKILALLDKAEVKAKSDDCLIQTLTDPENQPSQFGTVPIEWYENLENKLELYRFKVGEVIDSLDGSYEKHAIRKALQEAIEQ